MFRFFPDLNVCVANVADSDGLIVARPISILETYESADKKT